MEVRLYSVTKKLEMLVEDYESMIWTERFNGYGDFKLVVRVNHPMISLIMENGKLQFDRWLRIPTSIRIMIIETMEIQNNLATITGRSLESWLDRRTTDVPYGDLGDTDEEFVDWAPEDILIAGVDWLSPAFSHDKTLPIVEFYAETSSTVITDAAYGPGNLYSAITERAEKYKLGWSITDQSFPGDPPEDNLWFMVKAPGDRRPGFESAWSNGYGVIFDQTNDDLINVKTLYSNVNFRNAAFVSGDKDTLNYKLDAGAEGVDYYEIPVDATDIKNSPGATLNSKLNKRGRLALVEYKSLRFVEAEISPSSPFKYGTHYFLGDIVEFRDFLGNKTPVQITEYIWSVDQNGAVEYPTLEVVDV